MAINKRKILQSAQKHLQKGALEKALKDYQTLLKADPRDANLRLKIGDIELKRGRPDEAVAAYLKVAEAFMKDGFDAKAVALYKQITKIDDKRADVLVPLADLYQRMGLQSDAMAALQTAADAHYRDGNKDDALDLLRRMAALDPSNTNSRLKVADLLRQEERNEEAISEYEEVAAELDRQGAEEDRIRVLVRVLELAPDRVDLLASVARSRIDSGKLEAAEKTANLMIEQQPDEPDAWLLLGEARGGLGQSSESVDAYRRAAEIHRERGSDDVARDITQRFVAPAGVEDPGAGDAANDDLLGGAVEDLGAEAGAPDFDPNGMSLGSPLGESGADHGALGDTTLPPLPEVEESGVEAAAETDSDPEQLLAEASVYLRYGKHDRAIDSLRSIVRQDPTSVAAFAKLGEALEATGQAEHAITSYERGAQAAAECGDTTAFEALRQSVEALDAGRAEGLEPPAAQVASDLEDDLLGQPEAEPDAESEPESEEDESGALAGNDAEIEFDVDVELDASEEAAEPEEGLEPVVASGVSGDEFEIDGSEQDEIVLSESEQPDPSEAVQIDLSESNEIELSESDEIDVSQAVPVDPSDSGEIDPSASARDGGDVEADELVPEFDLSGELEISVEDALVDSEDENRDEDLEFEISGAGEDADGEVTTAEESLMDVSGEGAAAVEIEISDPALDLAFDDEEAAVPDGADFDESQGEVSLESPEEAVGASASATTPAQMAEDLEEADFFFQQGMLDEARIVYERILAIAPSHPGALLRVGEIEAASDGDADAVSASTTDADDIDVEAAAMDADDIEVEAGAVEIDPEELEVGTDETAIEAGEPEWDAESSDAEDDSSDMVDLVGDDMFADEDASSDELAPEVDLGGDPDDDTGRIQAAASEELEPEAAELGSLDDAAFEDSASEELEAEDSELDASAPELVETEAAATVEEGAPTSPTEAEVTAPVIFGASSEEDEGFDLAAQLSDAFDLDDEGGADVPFSADTEGEGFEEVFAAFKQGVQGALEDEDFEAHYDLGIAYKEMGLCEDAIGEFRAAMGSDQRRLPCLHMMGLCAMDLGRIVDAVAHLEQALALPDVEEEQQIGLRFDLGRAYAGVGDVPRARAAFEAVQRLDADFPDVDLQLAALDDQPDPDAAEATVEADDAGFENFDELMADGPSGPEEEAPEAPVYESFDDFLQDDDSEDEADASAEPESVDAGEPESFEASDAEGLEDGEAEDVGDAEPDEPEDVMSEPDEEPESEPDPPVQTTADPEPPKKPGRRKKKISFV
ncbi:MAG: tetratricopeptide repeat protein [bacterium]|nr:tetratricopeptide repeat protein [bacterium]